VATKGLELSLGKAVEVNVRATLLEPSTGLEDLQSRQLVASEFREPRVEHLIFGCWSALPEVTSTRGHLSGSQLFGKTWVILLRVNGVRQLFTADIMRFGVSSLRSAPI
jgi:hypothetical protein